MTEKEFKTFVEKYSDRIDNIRKNPDRTEIPSRLRDPSELGGSETLQEGRGASEELTQSSGTEDLTDDQLRELYESRTSEVSPEYRKQVEEYFRAISEISTTTEEGESSEDSGDE